MYHPLYCAGVTQYICPLQCLPRSEDMKSTAAPAKNDYRLVFKNFHHCCAPESTCLWHWINSMYCSIGTTKIWAVAAAEKPRDAVIYLEMRKRTKRQKVCDCQVVCSRLIHIKFSSCFYRDF